jgi:large subunit ribosomal protein L25
MANYTTIEAVSRERAGKGAARATRRAGKVPAVIYGAKQAPTLIALDPRTVLRELHKPGWRSRLFQVVDGSEPVRALIRDVQWHPVTDKPMHVDFQRLAPGEKIHVAVQVVFLNEGISPGLKRGGVLNIVRHTVEVEVDPDHIPERFEADLAGLDINDNIRWADLKGTEEARPLIADRNFVVATVAPGAKMEAAAEPAAAAATPAAPAKGKAPAKPAAAAKPGGKK